ncbi:unnamed protein product [Cylindrotheca closterium]|uniref:Uncharacterized protein n=1 Tax=Cylindrotheca closterium TaxID=2856 RepID=A0AAD2FYC1_9STRA|nr:unnamed protein product [Cylindrotheca closterium]
MALSLETYPSRMQHHEHDKGSKEAIRQYPSSVQDDLSYRSRVAFHPSRRGVINDTTDDSRSLFCENRAHSFYPEWTGQECDHDSFFCFTEGINSHCCKCRPQCCGQCNVTASYNDPYQACPVLDGRAQEQSNTLRSRLNTLRSELTYEQATQAIVIGIILAVLAFVLCIYCCLRSHQKRMEEIATTTSDRDKNLRFTRDDEYGDEGSFVNHEGISRNKSS